MSGTGILITDVCLGSADLDRIEAGCVMDLSAMVDRTGAQPVRTFDSLREAAEDILTQCRSHGYLRDAELLSVTCYRKGGIWVLEYAEDGREADPDDLTEGGGVYVAVSARTGEILLAWGDE